VKAKRTILESVVVIGVFLASLSQTAADNAAIYQQANQLEIEKRFLEAAQLWQSAQDDPGALYRAGMGWELAGNRDRAEQIYRSLLTEYPASAEVGKARFALALLAQGRHDFAEMEARLLWFLHAPTETIRRPEALALLGGHYIATRADRWAAFGCFETLRDDYPSHPALKMAVASWKQIENVGDLVLWSSVVARWKPTGLLPNRIPLFLLQRVNLIVSNQRSKSDRGWESLH
jgi:tetratricopeptide (TPR) repeat protein